jgi:hypothetical protein
MIIINLFYYWVRIERKKEELYLKSRKRMKEGKGAYGIVYSRPRLPLVQECIEDVTERNGKHWEEVSKVFVRFSDYAKEVRRYNKIHNSYSFPPNLFCIYKDHGRIVNSDILISSSTSNFLNIDSDYNEEWCDGDEGYKSATHQIVFPRGVSVFALKDMEMFLEYFYCIWEVLDFFSMHGLVFDDLKNNNVLFMNRRFVVADYSSVLSLEDLLDPKIHCETTFASRYYYIHSPILSYMLSSLVHEKPWDVFVYYSTDDSYFRTLRKIVSVIPSDFTYVVPSTLVRLQGGTIKKLFLEFFIDGMDHGVEEKRMKKLATSFYQQVLPESREDQARMVVERIHLYSIGFMMLEACSRYQYKGHDALYFAMDCCLQYYYEKRTVVRILQPSLSIIKSRYSFLSDHL